MRPSATTSDSDRAGGSDLPGARGGTQGQSTNPGQAAHPGRAAARLARAVENVLVQADLSLPQYRMLIFLDEGGDAAASALAGQLGVSRPSVTALVDGLVAKGLVERRADEQDRRRVAHSVTARGLEMLAAADALIEARLDELASNITPEMRSEAFLGLARWETALDTERQARLEEQQR